MQLDSYAQFVGESEIEELRRMAAPLRGRRLTMVNSTRTGGGVAEMLHWLVPLLTDLGIETSWEVIEGPPEFFAATKAIHNALHGDPFNAPPNWKELLNSVAESSVKLDGDFAIVHDPQPIALVTKRGNGNNAHWSWRCHVDLSKPNPTVWSFLKPLIEQYDVAIVSSDIYRQRLQIPETIMHPAIDPLADKNRDLTPKEISRVLERFGIDGSRPIVTQVSRFDRLKDPVGVIEAYRLVRKHCACQLILAGSRAADDPETDEVLTEVRAAADNDPDIHILDIPAKTNDTDVNALQRASTVVVQKSRREGFGLTVSEALWKCRPVVASAVGGIPLQIQHGKTGLLVHSIEECADQVVYLLQNPGLAKMLGDAGREYVRKHFIVTNSLYDHVKLLANFA